MKLEKNELLVDKHIYYLNQLPEILAVFQNIIEYYKTTLK
jgi:lipopolysaccharide biosynthesis protein